jgi:catechol 2,3-dioxygenase-like lactoylglutathione lyase family enzyme
LTRALATAVLAATAIHTAAAGQLAAPNAQGVAIGHIHVFTKDVTAQLRFWHTLGGTIAQRGKVTLAEFPGIYVILQPQTPSGGTVGTTLNHFGFHVRDFEPSVVTWKAAGVPWEPVTTNPAQGQGFVTGPDGVRVEFYEEKSIQAQIAMHHIHLLVPDPPAAQAWYGRYFGATPGTRLGGVGVVRTKFDTVNVPGAEITLSKATAPLAPTRGRSIDHIGFEVADIDRFVATLRDAGLKTDEAVQNSVDMPGVRVATFTDPWGTRIEITQGLANSRPAR